MNKNCNNRIIFAISAFLVIFAGYLIVFTGNHPITGFAVLMDNETSIQSYEEKLDSLELKAGRLQSEVMGLKDSGINTDKEDILLELSFDKIKDARLLLTYSEFEEVNINIIKIDLFLSEIQKSSGIPKKIIEDPSQIPFYWFWATTWAILLIVAMILYLLYRKLSLFNLIIPKVNKKNNIQDKDYSDFSSKLNELEKEL